jgi:pimeloyl-ACP methyl ester carboxylesterase
MPFAAPQGVELYYERHGDSGEPLVLVHGFTGDITDWRHQIEDLSRTHRLLIFDNRGHGRSAAPSEATAYGIDTMAADAAGMAAHVGFERYHLLGHSMGGAIAQEVALRWPAALLSLTLEDTSFAFREFRPRLPEGPPLLPPERLEEVAVRFSKMSQHVLAACWKSLATWEGTEARAGSIDLPALILCGAGDAPMLVDGARRLAELIPGAELHILAGAAHCPQEETPAVFNRLLRAFLERL